MSHQQSSLHPQPGRQDPPGPDPGPAFSPPSQKHARCRGPLRRAAPKDEERALGVSVILTRERIRGGVMDFFFFIFFLKGKKSRNEKERETGELLW